VGEYRATVEWAGEGDFAANRYSRAHRWRFDGGAEVPASASPQVVPIPFSDPASVDPEEALIASASSCHMLWFLHLARDAGLVVTSYRDEAVGTMGKDENGRIAFTRIVLRPRIDFAGEAPDAEALARLHEAAHDACFIANSLRTQIIVESSN
jgi:organic hydroperoxide reductase OsmC/OhrA